MIDWAKALDHGCRSDVAIFDFSKAFESVPHQHLLIKTTLYHFYTTVVYVARPINGFPRFYWNDPNELYWMVHSHTSYQYCQVYHKLRSSDLYFSCYISTTLPTASPPRSACCRWLYPLQTNQDTCDDCMTLQQDIDKLHHWSHTWQMAFNSKNCHIMTISHKRERPTLQYKLGDEHLSAVESFTYLGVTISIVRVHNIYAKATRVLNFIWHNIYHYTWSQSSSLHLIDQTT